MFCEFCARPGHPMDKCPRRNKEGSQCGKCAKDHQSKDCPGFDRKKCLVCGVGHESWSTLCQDSGTLNAKRRYVEFRGEGVSWPPGREGAKQSAKASAGQQGGGKGKDQNRHKRPISPQPPMNAKHSTNWRRRACNAVPKPTPATTTTPHSMSSRAAPLKRAAEGIPVDSNIQKGRIDSIYRDTTTLTTFTFTAPTTTTSYLPTFEPLPDVSCCMSGVVPTSTALVVRDPGFPMQTAAMTIESTVDSPVLTGSASYMRDIPTRMASSEPPSDFNTPPQSSDGLAHLSNSFWTLGSSIRSTDLLEGTSCAGRRNARGRGGRVRARGVRGRSARGLRQPADVLQVSSQRGRAQLGMRCFLRGSDVKSTLVMPSPTSSPFIPASSPSPLSVQTPRPSSPASCSALIPDPHEPSQC